VRRFLNHMELWLSAAGVGVILLVPGLLYQGGTSFWRATAYTAIAVGVLHGVIFWTVRRRQRLVREQTLREAHAMLRDGIHKQVAALLTMDAAASEAQKRRLDGVFDSMILLDHLLGSLSSERLRAWSDSEDGRAELMKVHSTAPRPAPDLHVHEDLRN
jgi:hypothetical protein